MDSKSEERECTAMQKVENVGSSFTSSVANCQQLATDLGLTNLTPSEVAEILVMMVMESDPQKTPLSFTDWLEDKPTGEKWHPEIFAEVLNQVSPDLDWKEVISSFDMPSFSVKSRGCLSALMSVLSVGLQNESFPVKVLYKRWTNSEAQLSWISQILRNSDVMSFADYPFTSIKVEGVELLPSDCTSKDILSWQSLELVTVLVEIGDNRSLFSLVRDCFHYPVKNCPVLLLAGLFMIGPPVSRFRREMLLTVLPIVYGNSTLPLPIFVNAWNNESECQSTYRNVLLRSVVSWYEKNPGEPSRLSRFVEMITKLQALPNFLNVTQHKFAIDLACLTFKSSNLPLDKWTQDKIHECGEEFAQQCVDFLNDRCFTQMNGSTSIKLAAAVSPEMVSNMLTGLQSSSGLLSAQTNSAVESIADKWRASTNPSVGANPVGASAPPSSQPMAPSPFIPTSTNEANVQYNMSNFTGCQSGVMGSAFGPVMPGAMVRPQGVESYAMPPGQQPVVFPGRRYDYATGGSMMSLPGGNGNLSSQPPYPNSGPLPFASPNVYMPSGTSTTRNFYGGGVQPQNEGLLKTAPPPANAWGAGFASASTCVTSVGQTPSYANSSNTANCSSAAPVQLSFEDAIMLDSLPPFPVDVQEEASVIFRRLFMQPPQLSSTVEQFVDLMKRLKESTIKRENDIACCMMKNLIEEFRFFNEYPEKGLRYTATVFGSCIRERLFGPQFMGVAMRLVMDALRRDAGSKLFEFGVIALEQFKCDLKLHPRYCQTIISHIPGFNNFSKLLKEYVQAGARSEDPITAVLASSRTTPFEAVSQVPSAGSLAAANVTTSSSSDTSSSKSTVKPSVMTANIDTLVNATDKSTLQYQPAESIQLQISFLFNNLSQANLTEKVEQMRDVISHPSNTPWVAQYLVVKRISVELNFHNLYFNFLTALNCAQLRSLVVSETYRNIKVLLCTDKSEPNFSDRTLLKNLGHWLGLMTIGSNRPIDRKSLDLKVLLVEAFVRGHQELLYVVPFAAKIMEACHRSHVFHTYSPWTMGILQLLCELHEEPDVKLNLKFEVEVLCRLLKIDIHVLSIGSDLHDPDLMTACLRYPQLGGGSFEHLVAAKMCRHGAHMVPPPQLLMEGPMGPVGGAPMGPVGGAPMGPVGAAPMGPVGGPLGPMGGAPMGPMGGMMPMPMPPVGNVMMVGNGTDEDPGMMMRPGGLAARMSPQPRFMYSETPVDIHGLFSMFEINSSIILFQINPPLKQVIRPAIEQAMAEVISATRDRTQKVPLSTIELLLRKDYATDGNEEMMMLAAHNMGRVLGAAMAMFHCRDPLYFAIQGYLKQHLYSSHRNPSPDQQRMIEEAAQILTDDNGELCLCYVMKNAAERLVEELDNALSSDYELRRIARSEGRPFLDVRMQQLSDEHLPPGLQLAPELVPVNVHSVYAEARVPGFKVPMPEDFYKVDLLKSTMLMGPVEEQCENLLHSITLKVDVRLQKYLQNNMANVPGYHALLAMRDAVMMSEQTSVHDFHAAASSVFDKLLMILFNSFSPAHNVDLSNMLVDIFLLIARELISIKGDVWAQKQVSKTLLCARSDTRLNLHAIDFLIRNKLADEDTVSFTRQLLRLYLVEKRMPANLFSHSDWMQAVNMLQMYGLPDDGTTPDRDGSLMEALRHLPPPFSVGDSGGDLMQQPNSEDLRHPGAPGVQGVMGGSLPQPSFAAARDVLQAGAYSSEGIPPLLSGFTKIGVNSSGQLELVARPVQKNTPAGYADKVESILREWMNVYYSPEYANQPNQVFLATFPHLHMLVNTEEYIDNFVRICTEMCVDLCHRIMSEQSLGIDVLRARCSHTLDAYVALLIQMVKHTAGQVNYTKMAFLQRIMVSIGSVLVPEQTVRLEEMRTLPAQRMLMMLFYGLRARDPLLVDERTQILITYCDGLHLMRPQRLPVLTYCWMDIVGHREFIRTVLTRLPGQIGFSFYATLLMDVIAFLAPFLRNLMFNKSVSVVYRGFLRILLVLLHDFPELLCDYHFAMCDVLPANCVQLRNLIISAYPRSIRLPDPFLPISKLELLPEMNTDPNIAVDILQNLKPLSLLSDLDGYLANRAPVSFLSDLRSMLQVSDNPGQKYDVKLLNAIVMYVGVRAIQSIHNKDQRPNFSAITHTAHMDIFQNLTVDLDTEGRYLFFNSIANQLRYPNSHTLYFGCTLLYLFSEANSEAIQEQITRVLFERLISLRPHPWGLMMTFIEMINNSCYRFWDHYFVRCSPEIERIARSCMGRIRRQ
uniref:CCR4-NOT transcription complex subunit 1 n=1 Tax=Trichuris muris TaxID=70415 RepID=A0A5S6QEM5_TRIMR